MSLPEVPLTCGAMPTRGEVASGTDNLEAGKHSQEMTSTSHWLILLLKPLSLHWRSLHITNKQGK